MRSNNCYYLYVCFLVYSASCTHLFTLVPPQTLIVGRTLPYNVPASSMETPIIVYPTDLSEIANYKGINTANTFVSYDRISPLTMDY
jgi:hypothetical protein